MRRIRQRLESLLTTDQFTYPELRNMFLTLLLDQFFIFFISLLSTMLVSRLGEAAMAAVSLVGTVNGMVSLLFTSLATGGAIAVARAKGRGDREEIRQTIGTVNVAEFFVTLAESAAFFVTMGSLRDYWPAVLGLIAGGIAAAPLAAWLCKKLPLKPLLAAVGLLIIAVNTWKLVTTLT